MQVAYLKTPLGIAELSGDESGVSSITVHDSDDLKASQIPDCLQNAANELQEYFENGRSHFTFAVNPSGTDFQKKVWRELLNIPYGKTVSYFELSKKLGDVKAIRAVASANAKNPL